MNITDLQPGVEITVPRSVDVFQPTITIESVVTQADGSVIVYGGSGGFHIEEGDLA